MLLTKTVKINLKKNIKYYENLGYDIPKRRDKWGKLSTPRGTSIIVKVEDLPEGSEVYIECLCDYCLEQGVETIIPKMYCNYIKQNKYGIIKKDCCKKCHPLKTKESNLLIYGVESIVYLKSTKDKVKITKLNKTSEEIEKTKIKKINTTLEKYGVESSMQNKEIMEKYKKTMRIRYGCDNPLQNELIKKKVQNTNINKYGFSSPMKNEVIKLKARKTLYKNSGGMCSKQQLYLNNLLNGELNYLVNYFLLDIAFPQEMIYLEYDGGGHKLSVKFGNETLNDFVKRNRRRWYYLYRNGWKSIRIISLKDKLPLDEVILQMIEYAKEYLNEGCSWIEFNIDNKNIKTSQFCINVDYGELRKITKIDISNIEEVV